MSELIGVDFLVFADASDTVVGACPDVALKVGDEGDNGIGGKTVVGGIASFDGELPVVVTAFLQSSASSSYPDISIGIGHDTCYLIKRELIILDVMCLEIIIAGIFLKHVDMVDAIVAGYPEMIVLVGDDTVNTTLVVGALHQLGVVESAIVLKLYNKQTIAPG